MKKIHFSDLVITIALNTKIKKVNKKILSLSGLLKKTDYDAKMLEIHEKYFTIFVLNLRVTYLM